MVSGGREGAVCAGRNNAKIILKTEVEMRGVGWTQAMISDESLS